ncbi:MAG: DEAD/DEAH box helicase [Actinobacteria bacterium]|nr:DEAD/DEAH box helicase [Actinomycetota bacterium]MBU4490582.1 DEAD/DEAH box helicase [Actinomycetota bacterium]
MRLIALHGSWIDSGFHIWGEDSAFPRAAKKPPGRPPKVPKPRPHPFAAGASELRAALEALSGDSLLTSPEEAAAAGKGGDGSGDHLAELIAGLDKSEVRIWLPTDSLGPVFSPRLVRDEDDRPGVVKGIAPWLIPTVVLPPGLALEFLVYLPETVPPRIALGDSLRFWSLAADLALETLARQSFYPDLEVGEDGVRARWRLLSDDGSSLERVRLLADSFPPVCRAHLKDGNGESPVAMIDGFLEATSDAFVRRELARAGGFPKRRGRKPVVEPVFQRWLAAAVSDDTSIQGVPEKLAAFVDEFRGWTDMLHPGAGEAPLRTCFRLSPPTEPVEGKRSKGKKAAEPPWTVTFHLQAKDDRSLLVGADKVWKTRSKTATFLKRRIEDPQERLLEDLGSASRLFPALDKALASPRPVCCELATEEAYGFLRETAPLLEQSGFGVLVPPWWNKPSARPGVRLKVSPKDSAKGAGSGLMGLDGIVDYDWEIAIGGETISREEFESLASLKVPLVEVRGQWVELRPGEIESAIEFFEKQQAGKMTIAEAMRLGTGGEIAGTGIQVVGVEADGWLAGILGREGPGKKIAKIRSPKGFRGKLRPYQVKGLSWLAFLDSFGLGGCLADDMGLGKTIQLIALLLHERRGEGKKPGPTLLVCPMSVVENWRREVQRFAPSLSVMVHHGTERLSGKAFSREARGHDMVISTYALANRDREHLAVVRWERVALDEAQNIKNPSAKQTRAIRSLKAKRRVALTGTPVENRLSELWSIMEFLNPGYLGPAAEFRRNFALPIERYHQAERAEQLRKLVQPFVLRRLKTDSSVISDLPDKMEMKVFCNLTREQATLYEAVVKDMMQKIEESEGVERKGLVLATLTKLKQVLNHPAQFLQDGSDIPGRSGKLARLSEMLEEVLSEGERALVFTQYAEMGKMLKAYLQETFGREVLLLYGGTGKKAREEMVRRFQEEEDGGPPVFVLSLKAGGVGLNLTAACNVFHFDRWWNPAVENQATDRAFRIGQKKNVQVYKYVCAGTMEERIDKMIEQKKELAENVVGAGEKWLTEFSTEQLRDVFTLSRETVGEG